MKQKLAWTLSLLFGVCLGIGIFPERIERIFFCVTLGILGLVVLVVIWDLLLKQCEWGRK